MRLFDASANLNGILFLFLGLNRIVDAFKGIYNRDIYYHDGDIKEVLERAHENGIDKMIIKGISFIAIFIFLGRTYPDIMECLKLANLNKNFYTSIGLHPSFTRVQHPSSFVILFSRWISIQKHGPWMIIERKYNPVLKNAKTNV